MAQLEQLETCSFPGSPLSVALTPSGVLQVAALDCPSQISIGESDDGMSICLTINGLTEYFARSAIQAISILALPGQSWIDIDGQIGIRAEVLLN